MTIKMHTFIKRAIGPLVLSLSLLWACKSSDVLPKDYTILARNQSARLESGVTVKADTIQDSRCPKDVVCITAGFATASLSLTKNDKTEKVKLRLGYRNNRYDGVLYTDSTVVSLSNESFSVILRAVNPYPDRENFNVTKEATVQVTRL